MISFRKTHCALWTASLALATATVSAESFAPGELLVKFKAGTSAVQQQQILDSLNLATEGALMDGEIGFHRTASVDLQAVLDNLAASGAIEYAQPNYTYTAISTPVPADDPELPRQWNLQTIAAQEAWAEESGSPVIVAVVDLGIDYNHNDLAAHMWVNSGEIPDDDIDNDSNGFIDDIHGYDFVNDNTDGINGEDADPMDHELAYHGTAVAGVLAAVRNNANEIAGVSSKVRVMALRSGRKVLQEDGSYALQSDTTDILQCFQYAIDNGAKIICFTSAGSYVDQAYRDAIAAAETAGILVVGGVDNNGYDVDSPTNASYPANFDNDNLLIVTSSNRNDRLSSFASYGAIDPIGGQTVFVQTPSVSMEWTQAFLNQIKAQHPDHEHIVVWDGAGFHPKDSSHEMIPEDIHIVTLPPYSPELNPIENLWDLIQDHTANKLWPTIARMDEVVGLHLKDWWVEPMKVIVCSVRGGYVLQQTLPEATIRTNLFKLGIINAS